MKAKPNTEIAEATLTVDLSSNGKDYAGKDEMNLAEFPITVLGDRPPKGVKTLVFKHGKGKLIVTGSDAFGLPTALDDDVILALIQLTKHRSNFTEPTVNFTRYELLRLLGWPNEGKSYRRLDESLKRWTGVTLIYEKCWWDNRAKRNVDANIHIIDDVVIVDGTKTASDRDRQQPLPLSTFTWNSRFMESFQADNLKDLDLDTYFSLKWNPSKRLYRFLDKRFYKRGDLTFALDEIAFTRVGFSQSYAHNVAKIKEKLQPAITELEEIGFLEPLSRDERYFKEADGWKVRIVKRKSPPALAEHSSLAPPEPSPLAAELIKYGVEQEMAAALVRKYPGEKIQLQIEILDWRLAGKKADKIDDPAAFLIAAIRSKDGYTPPKDFKTKAQQQEQTKTRQAKDRADAEASRRKQQDAARDRADKEAVTAYRKALTADELARHEAEAIAQATEEIRLSLDEPHMAKFRKTMVLSITDEHILQIIRNRQPQQ